MTQEYGNYIIDNMLEHNMQDFVIRELRIYHKEKVSWLIYWSATVCQTKSIQPYRPLSLAMKWLTFVRKLTAAPGAPKSFLFV